MNAISWEIIPVGLQDEFIAFIAVKLLLVAGLIKCVEILHPYYFI